MGGGTGEQDRDPHKERVSGEGGGLQGEGGLVWGVYLQRFKEGSAEGNRPPPGQTAPLLITGFPEGFPYTVKLSLSEHRSVLETIAVWGPPGTLAPPHNPCLVLTGRGGGESKVATALCQPSGSPVGLKQTAPFNVSHQEDPCTPG